MLIAFLYRIKGQIILKKIYFSCIEACKAINAKFEGQLPEPGKHIRLMHCDSRTGNRSICLNIHSDATGGYLYSYRDKEFVRWRWSESDRKRYLESNSKIKTQTTRRCESNQKLIKTLLRQAKPLQQPHAYLERKHLHKYGTYPLLEIDRQTLLRFYDDPSINYLEGDRLLLVPLRTVNEELCSAQLIGENGQKRFIKGQSQRKSFFVTKKLEASSVIGIAEGVATALSITQIEGFPVVAAMSCTRFRTIVPMIKNYYPKAKIIVLSDSGRGEEEARLVAQANGVCFVSPNFSDAQIAVFQKITGTTDVPTDFNDYFISNREL